ncbi:MAG: ribosome recycling factor [Chloroflexota bacterium]
MIDDILKETKEKMQTTVNVLNDDLNGMRGNRASTAMVDRLMVDYYGQATELRQLANISTPEAMQILIRPYDASAVKDIERAIQSSDLGINPNVDGQVIRLNMPPLTRERRQELVKYLHKRLEEARVAIRNIRRSANQDLGEFEKEKMISEDDLKRGEDQVQKLTDDFVKKIDTMGKEKEEDLMEV